MLGAAAVAKGVKTSAKIGEQRQKGIGASSTIVGFTFHLDASTTSTHPSITALRLHSGYTTFPSDKTTLSHHLLASWTRAKFITIKTHTNVRDTINALQSPTDLADDLRYNTGKPREWSRSRCDARDSAVSRRLGEW